MIIEKKIWPEFFDPTFRITAGARPRGAMLTSLRQARQVIFSRCSMCKTTLAGTNSMGAVLDGFEDSLGTTAKCAGALLVRHRHLDDIPLDFGIDHGCATDLTLAPLLAGAIPRGDLTIGTQRLCRRGGNRYKQPSAGVGAAASPPSARYSCLSSAGAAFRCFARSGSARHAKAAMTCASFSCSRPKTMPIILSMALAVKSPCAAIARQARP